MFPTTSRNTAVNRDRAVF